MAKDDSPHIGQPKADAFEFIGAVEPMEQAEELFRMAHLKPGAIIFYEENKLFIDAITCYEQAIKMDPENPTYKDAYEEFLLRNKLKNPK